MIKAVDGSEVTSLARMLRGVPGWSLATASIVLWTGYIWYAKLASRFSLDLRVYRSAALSLLKGHDPYHLLFTGYHLPFTYPPFALLVLTPLTRGSVHLVEALWWIVNALATVLILTIAFASALPVRKSRALMLAVLLTPVLSLLFEPARSNTNYGQINALLLAAVLLDVVGVKGRGRGVLVGLAAAIKLTPLIYVFSFVVARDWRAVLRSALTFFFVGGVTSALLPRESRLFWFHQVGEPGRAGSVSGARNQSWDGVVHRWPFPHSASAAFWAVLAVATLAVGTMLAQRLSARGRVIDVVVALGLTGELVSPISWSHHWIWILILPVLLLRGFQGQPAVMAAMLLLCLVGAVGPYAWATHGWLERGLSDTLALAGGLLLVTWCIAEERRHRRIGPPVPHGSPVLT
jgi:alpha-1,2-mannosyltransferase